MVFLFAHVSTIPRSDILHDTIAILSCIQRLCPKLEIHGNSCCEDLFLDSMQEEKDKKIQELYDELQCERERCAAFRQQLHTILKDLEEHADFMSIRVEDIVNSLKEIELDGL